MVLVSKFLLTAGDFMYLIVKCHHRYCKISSWCRCFVLGKNKLESYSFLWACLKETHRKRTKAVNDWRVELCALHWHVTKISVLWECAQRWEPSWSPWVRREMYCYQDNMPQNTHCSWVEKQVTLQMAVRFVCFYHIHATDSQTHPTFVHVLFLCVCLPFTAGAWSHSLK